ncbi:Non-specific lipid-transfer protein [Thalictrum thalictroides]|uniref:Non-specific lipid-transfer protein n=1 Tax=Thalictrum thalictroides TaxID=46969 RepID=A0A7J6VRH6_THATH|nr:Non-specific lipid-transfer protein [Thalictrum thalictroides]
MMKGVILGVIVVLAMVLPRQAFNCMDVTKSLVQCSSYVIGPAHEPSKPCCDGVKQLKAMAVTGDDKRQICSCCKNAASHYGAKLKNDAVTALPAKCGAPLPFTISKSFDCDSIP